MWTRSELKERGKDALHRNYWKAVGFTFLMGVLAGGGSLSGLTKTNSDDFGAELQQALGQADGNTLLILAGVVLAILGAVMLVSWLITLFVKNPIEIGFCKFLEDGLEDSGSLDKIGYGFKNGYLRNVGLLFLRELYISLWSLLLVIPGIIKSYEYRMTPYIAAEHPEMSVKDVFAESRRLMTGNKWSAFVLDLSFIGWYLLSGVTCGILAIFWVSPYREFTNAALYDTLKNRG